MNFLCRDTESCKNTHTIKGLLTENYGETMCTDYWKIRVSDLLHFRVEVYVAVGNDELYGFICDVLVRRFHRNSPDEVHPSQIQSLHTLRESIIYIYIYIFARLDINAGFSLSILLRTSRESHTSCVPCRLRRWSLRFTFSKKVLKRLNPVRHWWNPEKTHILIIPLHATPPHGANEGIFLPG